MTIEPADVWSSLENTSIAHVDFGCLDDGDDDAKETDDRSENFHHYHLHEERGILSVGKRGTRANNANGNAAKEIAETDRHPGGKNRKSREVILLENHGIFRSLEIRIISLVRKTSFSFDHSDCC